MRPLLLILTFCVALTGCGGSVVQRQQKEIRAEFDSINHSLDSVHARFEEDLETHKEKTDSLMKILESDTTNPYNRERLKNNRQ